MCYFCHTLGHNPSAPPHRSARCIDPRNSHGRKFVPAESSPETDSETGADICTTPAAPGSVLRSKCTLCGKSGHTAPEHKCPVCKSTGHRGRDCPTIETEGLPGRKVKLFHITTETTAKSIVTSQKFKPGTSGMFGAGCYFAKSPEDCSHKARNKGATLEATVQLGRSLVRRKSSSDLTKAKLAEYDCQSVKGDSPAVSRPEYAILDPVPGQISHIKVIGYNSTPNGPMITTRANWPAWVVDLDVALAKIQPLPTGQGETPSAATSRVAPIAKSTGKPDRRYKGAKHGGSGSDEIPIAKSTGKPDRRYSPSRHGGSGSDGIPIAKSTGLPDRRYSPSRHGGSGSDGIPIAKSTGLPDRRYNPALHTPIAGGGFSGFAGSPCYSFSGFTGGPLKMDGTPDMRYAVNRM